jgi:virginiamycin B lyase
MTRGSPASLAAALLCLAAPVAAHGQSAQLPEGAGQGTVQAVCTGCHGINQIQNSSGYTREGWEELISTMIDLSDSPELKTITDYLATHFPETTDRAPKLVPGDASITFTQWRAPTLGQRSRDPVQAPDGSIWWAGQWGDLVGRVDPETGEIGEFPLPPGSKPHTVTADRDGNIWYTGNGNGTMGRLDPRTGEITVYEMPDPAARDPHSAIIDPEGTVWFTLQQSNMVGRLIPATGEVELVTMPVEGSRPYGIKLSSKGVPWVASNGSNRLYRIDPETMGVREYPLPDPATTVRRLAFASDDTIWFVNSSQGRLGHLDPETGEVEEWPSPSGPDSHPYAIAVIDDIVWYNESGKRPDALVRFDPKTEEFQSWTIPSGDIHAGIVRHMRPTREGNLLIHQSSTNRVLLVTLEHPATE